MKIIANENELLSNVVTGLPQARRILVCAPHPDDEVFGCGGTLALFREQGAEITVIIATDGAGGGPNADGALPALREAESRAAAKVLGLVEPIFWNYADRGLVYGEQLIDRLVAVLVELDADLVLLPSPTELHPDHQVLAFAGAEALHRLGGDLQGAFYEINAPLPTPNLFVDISSVTGKKREAMHCFPSQLAEQPYDIRIEGLNRFRSFFMGADVTGAEAFQLLPADLLGQNLADLFESPLIVREKRGFGCPGGGDRSATATSREHALAEELRQVSAELAAVYASRSWRFTRPLRNAVSCLRSLTEARGPR